MDEKKKKEWKRKAAVGVVAAAASASVLVGGAFDSPADLLSADGDDDNGSPTPVVHTLAAQTADLVDDASGNASDDEDEERRQRFPAVRRWMLSLPVGVRALIGVPLWAAGWAITAGLSLLWNAALAPIGGRILAWVLAAIAAVLVFALTARALFPNVPWKKILRPRNILLVVIGSPVVKRWFVRMTDGFSSTFNILLRQRSVKASARKKTRRGPRPPPGAKKVGNRACFFPAARYSICCLQRRPQSCGVMVAQVILVHFVEVRILAGLPIFLPARRSIL